MSVKIQIKYLMYKVGLRDTIPAQIVNKVQIDDNAEKLVDVKQNKTVFLDKKLADKEHIYLRKTVYEKLLEAQKYLPENYYFKIFSAYRPLEEQQALWKRKFAYFKQKYPSASEEKITQLTKAVCSDPRNGFGGHQTGGAIDIGLCDKQGQSYEMGTNHSEVKDKTRTKSKKLTIAERKNRYILYNALTKVGFVNYPAEWWHYSYGDRMWAAYTGKKKCVYGLVKI